MVTTIERSRVDMDEYNNGTYRIKRCAGESPFKIIDCKTGRVVGSSGSLYLARENVRVRMVARERREI